MGFLEVLVLIFVTLKLTEVIDWSWWMVFSPFAVYAVVAILFCFGAVYSVLSGKHH